MSFIYIYKYVYTFCNGARYFEESYELHPKINTERDSR